MSISRLPMTVTGTESLVVDRKRKIADKVYHASIGSLGCAAKVVKESEQLVLSELHAECEGEDKHIIRCFPDKKQSFGNHQYFFPLEYCEHGDLQSVLIHGYDGQHLNDAERKCMLHKIVKALVYVHSLDYVHLDLKPRNIMVGANRSSPKLADFGITTRAGQPHPKLGSAGYISPEVAKAMASRQDIAALKSQDIFSLGVVAYQLLTMKDGAEDLPHPFERSGMGNSDRPLQLQSCINDYKLSINDSSLGIEAVNLIESMLQPVPDDRPKIHEILEHPFFWSYEKRERLVSSFLRDGKVDMLNRVFAKLSQATRLSEDLSNPALPITILALDDFIKTACISSGNIGSDIHITREMNKRVTQNFGQCSSAFCQLFVSKYGDLDPGVIQGCPQCTARVDHFCNEVRYDHAGIKEDPRKTTESIKATGNECWYQLKYERTRSVWQVTELDDCGSMGKIRETSVHLYTISPSPSRVQAPQPVFMIARCWVASNDPSRHTPVQASGRFCSKPALPQDQQAFKIVPFRILNKEARNFAQPCYGHLRCWHTLASPLNLESLLNKTSEIPLPLEIPGPCARHHEALQLCSSCALLEDHVCTKHSHSGLVRVDLLDDGMPCLIHFEFYNTGIYHPLGDTEVKYIFAMLNDIKGPSRLRRVPLPIFPGQVTCLFGPYCRNPSSCLLSHQSSLTTPLAQVHPGICPECSLIYAKLPGHSHYCFKRNYNGFIVEHGGGQELNASTKYRLWHLREEEKNGIKFHVYSVSKEDEQSCEKLHFSDFNHLPGMLDLSTRTPHTRHVLLQREKERMEAALAATVACGGFNGRSEFVTAVQRCNTSLGQPEVYQLVALPYASTGLCTKTFNCTDGLACQQYHSPAGEDFSGFPTLHRANPSTSFRQPQDCKRLYSLTHTTPQAWLQASSSDLQPAGGTAVGTSTDQASITTSSTATTSSIVTKVTPKKKSKKLSLREFQRGS